MGSGAEVEPGLGQNDPPRREGGRRPQGSGRARVESGDILEAGLQGPRGVGGESAVDLNLERAGGCHVGGGDGAPHPVENVPSKACSWLGRPDGDGLVGLEFTRGE